jgi:hypothetical protein
MQKELEQLLRNDTAIVAKSYISFGNHIDPKTLKTKVITAIDGLYDTCDAVIVAFGTCQSLTNLADSVSIPIFQLDNEDCISILLTKHQYQKERSIEPGTFFMTPGWCQSYQVSLFKDLHIQEATKKRGIDEDYILRLLFKNYTRLLFIDTGIPNPQQYEVHAQALAQRLNLRYEKTQGTIKTLQSLINKAKNQDP